MLSIEQVLEVLYAASSGHDHLAQQAAMSYLEKMQDAPGIAWALAQIIIRTTPDTDRERDCKLMAAIQLKHVVSGRWLQRGGSRPVVPLDEQAAVRHSLLQFTSLISSNDKRVSLQLAIVTAKIARIDWPDKWPELFPALVAVLSTTSPGESVLRRHAANCLLDILTELGTKSLSFAKTSFASLCVQLFMVIAGLWIQETTALTTTLYSARNILFDANASMSDRLLVRDNVSSTIDYLVVICKIISKLLENGFLDIGREGNLAGYFTKYAEISVALLDISRDFRRCLFSSGVQSIESQGTVHQSNPSFVSIVIDVTFAFQELIETVSKIPPKMLLLFPLDMASYLEGFLLFFFDQLLAECKFSHENNRMVDGSFGISAVSFLDEVIGCKVYAPSKSESEPFNPTMQVTPKGNVARLTNRLANGVGRSEAEDEELARFARQVRDSFLSDVRLSQLLELCLNHLLRYDAKELEEWTDDSEHFYLHQMGLKSTDTVKAASEHLYLSMLETYSGHIVPVVVSFLQDSNRQLNCVSTMANDKEIEFWDAVYLCVGLGSHCIGKHINPSEWLSNSLGSVLNVVFAAPSNGSLQSGQQLLRARFMWLLSCWMYYWDPSVLATLSQLLVSVFDPSSKSDVVVKLTSLQTLETLLASDQFEPRFLLPLIQQLVGSLCNLIHEVEDSDTKGKIVDMFQHIALAMGKELQPIFPPLVQYLGNIWQASDEKSPLRRTILEVLTTIVREAGSVAPTLSHVIIPLIHYAIAGSQAQSVDLNTGDAANDNEFLAEEGISLWLALARNYSEETEEALKLLNLCLSALFRDQEPLYSDLDSSCLKDLSMVVEVHAIYGGINCLQSTASTLKAMYDKLLGNSSPRIVPYLLRPLEAFALSCPADTATFAFQCGILLVMVRACCAYISGLQEAMKQYHEPEIVLVSYLSFLCRVLICSPQCLHETVTVVVNELISLGAAPHGTSGDVLMKSIVRLIVDMIDMVGSCAGGMWRRKLWTLSLLSLYPTSDSTLLDIFPEVLNITDSAVCEEKDDEAQGQGLIAKLAGAMTAISTEDAAFVGDEAVAPDPVTIKMGELVSQDIVMRSSLIHVAHEKFQALRAMVGDARCSQLVQSLPPPTMQRLFNVQS